MPRVTETITVELPIAEAFAYLSDFTNTQEWDPGVEEATQVAGHGAGHGARVEVQFGAGPVKLPLTYETTHFEEPTAVTFTTRNRLFHGEDTLTLSSSGSTTTLVWDAVFGFVGPLGLADPILDIAPRGS